MKTSRFSKFLRTARWVSPLVIIVAASAVVGTPALRSRCLAFMRPARIAEVSLEAPNPYHVAGDAIEVPAELASARGIDIVQVRASREPVVLTLTGKTGLNQATVTHVHAQFPGRIVEVGPELAALVTGAEAGKTGSTQLCVIESTDLAGAKSDYLKAKVQDELDRDTLKRTMELVKSSVLGEKAQFDADNAVKKSDADLDAARQRLFVFGLTDKDLPDIGHQQGRERMTYSIYAPRSGTILEKNVTQGELADPSLNLFTIADTSTLWIWGDVYERDWSKVHVGQKMRAYVSGHPDEPRACTIDWISPIIDGGTRSVRVRGTIDNPGHRLLADMYATLDVTLDEGDGSIIVPSAAVVRTSGGAYVFVRTGEAPGGAYFQRRRVEIQTASADRVRITAGVKDGDVVVSRGALGLSQEMEQP